MSELRRLFRAPARGVRPLFWEWQKRSPDDLYKDPAVADLLTALDASAGGAITTTLFDS
jgi:hypothetical protein